MRTPTVLTFVWISVLGANAAIAGYRIDYVVNPFREGIADSWMFDINDSGQSTGYVIRRDEVGELYQSPVLYRDGEITELDRNAATFGASTTGLFINDGADVVVRLRTDPPSDNYFYVPFDQEPVPIFKGEWGLIEVQGLNNSGQVLLCDFEPMFFFPTDITARIKIWTTAGMQTLTQFDAYLPQVPPPDPNDFNSGPSSITGPTSFTNLNDAGQFAAGRYFSGFDPQDPANPDDDLYPFSRLSAFVFDGAGGISMLAEPAPGDVVDPISIDEDGVVFGFASDPLTPVNPRLALWNLDGSLKQLLPDAGQSLLAADGYAVRNDLGQVLALTADQAGLLLYDPLSNDWTDILPSIVNLGEGSIYELSAFNNQGQFVGLALHPHTDIAVFGFVASPVPEPASWALAVLTMAVGLIARVRKRECRSAPQSLAASGGYSGIRPPQKSKLIPVLGERNRRSTRV